MTTIKRVLLDICTICPHGCVYCYHQNLRKNLPRTMPLSVGERILDILTTEGVGYVSLYMSGDPFMNSEVYDFIRAVGKRKMSAELASKLAIPINFDALRIAVDTFKNSEVHFVVQIDAFRQETADKVAKGLDVARQMKNLEKLKELLAGTRGTIHARTLVTKHNEGEVPEIERAMKDLGLPWRHVAVAYYKLDVPPDIIRNLRPETYPTRIPVDLMPKRPLKCALSDAPAIGPDGEVSVCCHDMSWQAVMGNILETGSLSAVLESQKGKEILKAAKERTLPICFGCN